MRTFTHGHTASPLNKKLALTNSNFVQIDFYVSNFYGSWCCVEREREREREVLIKKLNSKNNIHSKSMG